MLGLIVWAKAEQPNQFIVLKRAKIVVSARSNILWSLVEVLEVFDLKRRCFLRVCEHEHGVNLCGN